MPTPEQSMSVDNLTQTATTCVNVSKIENGNKKGIYAQPFIFVTVSVEDWFCERVNL